MTTKPPAPTRVTLSHWTSRAFGDRWTLTYQDRAVITRSTEAEARQAARECGWVVDDATRRELR
jgi:hypothetical protein